MVKAFDLRNVKKSFGGLRVIDDVSMSVDEGKITILMGPNGAGKTTLINVISGFYKPDSGEIYYRDKRITGLKPQEIYRLGIVRTFQIPMLFWKQTVLENLLIAQGHNVGESFFYAPIRSFWINPERQAVKRAWEILELLGLSGSWDSEASKLSGGQMKLLELGRAMMSNVNVILLDEPISGVNPTLAHEIFGRIVKLKQEMNLTFLIVEHRLDIALQYSDHVIAMAFGKLVAEGSADNVVNDPRVIETYLGA